MQVVRDAAGCIPMDNDHLPEKRMSRGVHDTDKPDRGCSLRRSFQGDHDRQLIEFETAKTDGAII